MSNIIDFKSKGKHKPPSLDFNYLSNVNKNAKPETTPAVTEKQNKEFLHKFLEEVEDLLKSYVEMKPHATAAVSIISVRAMLMLTQGTLLKEVKKHFQSKGIYCHYDSTSYGGRLILLWDRDYRKLRNRLRLYVRTNILISALLAMLLLVSLWGVAKLYVH